MTGAEEAVALRRRLALVRGRPAWSLAMVGASVVASVLFFTWGIGFSGVSTYYAASAASMASSPWDLLTGSLDRSGTITLDKLSGFLVPQALAIRLFGLHAWALSLPQAVEGVATLLGGYALAVRWRGPALGALAAASIAVTPMLAAMFGRPMEDGMLTMATVLAVVAAQRAAIAGRPVWLLAAAVWVAVGFQAKMLQAWFVVPAVLMLWIVAGPGTRGRRTLIALAAGAVTAILSLSWITVIQLLPHRPYADGTTDGSMFSMVFGYNGVDRIVPGLVPGSVPQLGGHGVQLPTRFSDAMHSPLKLLLPSLTTQLGWLYPLAFAGLVLLVATSIPALRRRMPRAIRAVTPHEPFDRGMTVALVLWLGVTAIALTPAAVPHATYFAPIAVPVALLAGVGIIAAARLLRDSRTGPGTGWRWAAPALVAAETLWSTSIIAFGPPALRGVALPVLVAGALGVLLLAAGIARRVRAVLAAGIVASGIAVATAPAVWSTATILPGGGGSASDAYAGPRVTPLSPRPPASAAGSRTAAPPATPPGLRPPFVIPPDAGLDGEQRRLVDYVRAHAPGTRALFATDSMPVAVSIILGTPDDAIPMGGFSKQAPSPTPAGLRSMVRNGTTRYVLLIDPGVALPPNPTVERDRAWVRAICTPVLEGRFRHASPERQTLYDCAAVRG